MLPRVVTVAAAPWSCSCSACGALQCSRDFGRGVLSYSSFPVNNAEMPRRWFASLRSCERQWPLFTGAEGVFEARAKLEQAHASKVRRSSSTLHACAALRAQERRRRAEECLIARVLWSALERSFEPLDSPGREIPMHLRG